ncbi:MAG: hypothetical protein KAW45_02880 [Thermoplasmatales archaeon]|nr:hypothetical protein [Thermoplasmatales archaeon]
MKIFDNVSDSIFWIYKRTIFGILMILFAIYLATLVSGGYAFCIVIAFIGGLLIWFDLHYS